MTSTTTIDIAALQQRLRELTLYGLAAQDGELLSQPWVQTVIDIEHRERQRRSLVRRLGNARIGAFKPIADFDWLWPMRIEHQLIAVLFSLSFIEHAANVALLGPNGVGKTMLAKNLLHHTVMNGYTARFTIACDRLHELTGRPGRRCLPRAAIMTIDLAATVSYR